MASDAVADVDRVAEPARCREFVLSDGMILIAGTALFLSMGSYLFAFLIEMLVSLGQKAAENRAEFLSHWPSFWKAIRYSFVNSLSYSVQILGNFLVSLMFAFFILRWKRPRPPLRLMLRQPGTVAVIAVLFGGLWIVGFLDYLFYPTIDNRLAVCLGTGGTVTVAWAVLALSRQWQAEPGWIDRMGRGLGVAAIVYMMLGILQHVVIPMVW
ncbi:hypothetical protein SAMN05444166_4289 [Singulisphaera sp. GP187]|uniref:hypothetical protein n=1 Tax=Singulisphaera sp. GP187 TaxID=1882752 RepID=UPI000929C940|nr:hypothetical protein [Singulisphaera sp. GP187]SIO38716.1 hypothetical protein SAMN05444166_4289 [Singulisphaera sp. GP187]